MLNNLFQQSVVRLQQAIFLLLGYQGFKLVVEQIDSVNPVNGVPELTTLAALMNPLYLSGLANATPLTTDQVRMLSLGGIAWGGGRLIWLLGQRGGFQSTIEPVIPAGVR